MLVRFGVMIVAWLAIISGAIGALIGAVSILIGAVLDAEAPTGPLNMQGLGGMALVVVGLTFAIVGLFTGAFTIPSLISTVVSAAILMVLLSPHVRKHVRQIRERTAQPATLSSATTVQRP